MNLDSNIIGDSIWSISVNFYLELDMTVFDKNLDMTSGYPFN